MRPVGYRYQQLPGRQVPRLGGCQTGKPGRGTYVMHVVARCRNAVMPAKASVIAPVEASKASRASNDKLPGHGWPPEGDKVLRCRIRPVRDSVTSAEATRIVLVP